MVKATSVEQCIAQGLLREGVPDLEKALRSLKTARHKLKLARMEVDARIYENAVISAYTSMFHAARALLYRDGFKERSHYALFVYLSEKYEDKLEKKYFYEFETLRLQRHELMYGLEDVPGVSKPEARDVLCTVEEFITAVDDLINKSG